VIMVSASSVVAHLVKLLVTAMCMGHLAEPYRVKALPITWSLRAFRILFMHSILGIFRFGKMNAFMPSNLVAFIPFPKTSLFYYIYYNQLTEIN